MTPVELSLNALVERLDDHFFERATRTWRVASGVQPDLPPVPELPELTRLDAWQAVTEVLSSPRVDEAKRARLELLQRHIARAYVEAHAADAIHAERRALATATFQAGGRAYTSTEATHELPRLAARDLRQAVARGLSAQLLTLQATSQRRIDLEREAIEHLGSTPDGFAQVLQGRPLSERLTQAQEALTQTKAASDDLLAYGLKKLDPLLTLRTAEHADARRVALAPWLFESFRKEDLSHAITRCLGDLGLSADGRLTADTERRPLRDPAPLVVELRVPDHIRLLLTPDSGIDTYADWLSNWGIAVFRANVGRTLPFVERRLGDRAVIDAIGLLFESFLLEEGWLKRYLRLTQHQAREAARIFAFRQLLRMRWTAGRALFSSDVANRPATAALGDDFQQRMTDAVGAEVLPGAALNCLDVLHDSALTLDAYALEHVLRGSLRARFNEDFWRNPATGRWLLDVAASGQRDDAVTIAKTNGAPLSLTASASERVAVMGA